jgi:hypothetical protein
MDNTTEQQVPKKDIPLKATPKLGIIKGVILILLGIIWLNNYSIGALIGYQDTGSRTSLLLGVIWGWVIFGFCVWRGIVAIYKRNKLRVSSLNIGVWTFIFVVSLIFILWITFS